MKSVKIVFIDLDSTLTTAPGKIDIQNKRIFERLANIGIPIVINTGRPLPYVIPLCKQFGTSNYVIASNGAEIYNFLTKKVINRSVISKEEINKLDELVKQYNLFFMANGLEKRYTNKTDPNENKGFVVVDELNKIDDSIAQVVIQSYNLEAMMQLRKDLEENTELCIANKTKHIEENKLLYYDVVNKGVNKGEALEILCKYLDINPEKAMAIGDSDNDIPMLEKVGYKVAVANGTDNLKAVANIITLSNKQNGVATVLNELFTQIVK